MQRNRKKDSKPGQSGCHRRVGRVCKYSRSKRHTVKQRMDRQTKCNAAPAELMMAVVVVAALVIADGCDRTVLMKMK